MSGLSNLPPGVRECDIPGNRPIDAALDNLGEVFTTAWKRGVTLNDVLTVWHEVEDEMMAEERRVDETLRQVHVFLEDDCERCGQSIADADEWCPGVTAMGEV